VRWVIYVAVFAFLSWNAYSFVKTKLLPYSSLYGGKALEAPNGVGVAAAEASQHTVADNPPKAVKLTPIVDQEPASPTLSPQSASFRVALVDSHGKPVTLNSSQTVTLSSSSTKGVFSTGIAATISLGSSSVVVHYADVTVGTAQITGFVSGLTPGTIGVQISPGPASTLSKISPNATRPNMNVNQSYAVNVQDGFGNPVSSASVVWQVTDMRTGNPVQPDTTTQSAANGLAQFTFTPTQAEVGHEISIKARLASSVQVLVVIPIT
jgi:hypothetical protein